MFVKEEHKKEIYYVSLDVPEVLKHYSMKAFGYSAGYSLCEFKKLDTGKMFSEKDFIAHLTLECGYNPFLVSGVKLDFTLTGNFVDGVGVEIPIKHLTSMNLTIEFDKDSELEEENDDEEGED